MIKGLAQCLTTVHDAGKVRMLTNPTISQLTTAVIQVHADIKPLNVVRTRDNDIRLIDLDAMVDAGTPAGVKASTAYCPPEMAFVDENSDVQFKHETQVLPKGESRCLATPGCVLFRALVRKPLFESDDADNIYSHREKLRLCKWTASDLDACLGKVRSILRDSGVCPQELLAANDLLAWTLHPDPNRRPQSGYGLLCHAFFSTGGVSNYGILHMSDLHRAAACGDIDFVKEAVGGATGDCSGVEAQLLSKSSLLEKTPLHMAALALHEDTVLTLLRIAESGKVESAPEVAELNGGSDKVRVARQFVSSISRKAKEKESLLHKCLNMKDIQNESPLRSLLKLTENLESGDLETAMRIIQILAGLTDLTEEGSEVSDEPTILDVGKASPVKSVRDYFMQLSKGQNSVKRRTLFSEYMESVQEKFGERRDDLLVRFVATTAAQGVPALAAPSGPWLDEGIMSERNATKPHALHEGLHERFCPQLIWGTHTRSPNWYR